MDNPDQLLVSIITPLYNSKKYVKDCVASVQKQRYQNWEMIVVDDCSTDGSYELVVEMAKVDSRVKVFRLAKNSGSGAARNVAIENAQGCYIAFLDSDDIWHENKLQIQIAKMIENNAAFSHTSYGYLSENGEELEKILQVSKKWVNYKKLLRRTEISCLTAIYDVRKVGKQFMPEIRLKQDYALWLAILKAGFLSLPIQEKLAWYRQRSQSATAHKYKLILNHIWFLHQIQGLNLISSFYYTFLWMVNGFVRYYLK